MATQLSVPFGPTQFGLADLTDVFEIDDAEAISRYLGDHPGLVPDLHKARLAIDRHFGAHSRVRLKILIDPDGGRGSSFLYLYVQTREPVDEALATLDRLDHDEQWWPDATAEFGETFVISVEHA